MRHFSRRESGQAAVETAIVMPLFVFITMGIIQLSLAHQARLMTRYAAYKAARAGALHRAQKTPMKNAALAVLVPMIPGMDEKIKPPVDIGTYATAWQQARSNTYASGGGLPIVDVTICNPLSGNLNENNDFDDPKVASGSDWQAFLKTRLHVQVTFNYPLLIPFANGVLFWMTAGIESQQQTTFQTLRLRNKHSDDQTTNWSSGGQLITSARMGKYFMPIRANYAMRMQSNVASGALPSQSDCYVNFKKKSNDNGTTRTLNLTRSSP